jgi:hypothetical protein
MGASASEETGKLTRLLKTFSRQLSIKRPAVVTETKGQRFARMQGTLRT